MSKIDALTSCGEPNPVLYTRETMGETAQTRTPEMQLFHDVFNSSPVGIAVENLDGQPLFINPAFCSFLGFSEGELRDKHCVDFSPTEDAEKDWALFQQLRSGSIDHYELEKRYFRRDGSLVWGHLSVSLLKSRPSPLVVAMVEDISEKKVAEEARFRHAAIVESSEDAIISKNLDATIMSWNAGAQRIFGYTENEAVGRPITILIPPDLLDEETKILERLRAGRSIEHYETIRVTKSGKRINVSLLISQVKDSTGKVVGFCKIARDITERKRAERVLRETNQALQEQAGILRAQEELLRIFVQNVPADVAMLDRDMRYLQVSERFCTDYGIKRSEVLGCSHYDVFPDMPDHWKEVHRRALSGETLRANEDRWERKAGTTWVRWEVRPWQTADASTGGILIFAEDITRRKQMEDSLRSVTRKLLESQEQERTRIGRELHDDIAQRLALLAVKISQLRANPSEIETRLRKLGQETNEIAEDVQFLSHELHSSKLEILGVVRSLRSWCREFGAGQGVEIDFKNDVISALPVDIGLCLLRVLQEALHNAVKHSGVKRIEVHLAEQSSGVQLTVTDSGKGFDIDIAKQDSGLGLTSMQERVRLLSGTMTIQSKPMEGTTIRVHVPIRSEDISQRAAS